MSQPSSTKLGRTLCLGAFLVCFACVRGAAQTVPDVTDDVSRSPRASIERFLALCRAGKFGEASALLELSPGQKARGAELARKLDVVLGAKATLDLDAVSDRAEGDVSDGLPGLLDEIAKISDAAGAHQSVRLVRRKDGDEPWKFTRATVARIEPWYDGLPHRWFVDWLPSVLRRPGPYQLDRWQWLALPVLGFVAWLIGAMLSRLSTWVFVRMASRTSASWDDVLARRVHGPLALWWTLAAVHAALPWLGLRLSAAEASRSVLRAVFLASVFWMFSRTTDVFATVLARTSWAEAHAASRSLLPLGARVAKVAILAFGVVSMLSQLGYPVTSLLAGLGIGGLAVALAAQKTVENLIGAFSLGADQPFREGDFVKVEDFVGTVEHIGLRSTRIRTLDRTLITLPNGKLADMRLESFTARDRLRLACTIGLVYDTTPAQMQRVLVGLREVLQSHEKIWPESIVVRFKELGASSLDIEVMAWFLTRDWAELQAIREQVLLSFMGIVAQAGTSFAFPTQTLHLAMEASPAATTDPGASTNG